MDLTIVIPQRGNIDLTLDCLMSLRRVEPARWPVIVVDDGSSPEERERFVYSKPAGVRFIEQAGAGVTAAWNEGVSHVCTPVVLFLNNDVLFHEPTIEQLLAPLQQPEVMMTGVRFREEPVLSGEITSRFRRVRFLQGWAFACRVEDYYRVGGFDEQLELYFSDTDFQLRMMEGGGPESLRVVDRMGLEHLGHRTAHRLPDQRKQWRRDRELFRQKWLGQLQETSDASVTADL